MSKEGLDIIFDVGTSNLPRLCISFSSLSVIVDIVSVGQKNYCSCLSFSVLKD